MFLFGGVRDYLFLVKEISAEDEVSPYFLFSFAAYWQDDEALLMALISFMAY